MSSRLAIPAQTTTRLLGDAVADPPARACRQPAEASAAALLARPFELRIPSGWHFEHANWRSARQTVLEAMAAGWVALLVGESGAGKTLLLRNLARTLAAAGLRVQLTEVGDAQEKAVPGVVRLIDEADALDEEELRALALSDGPAVIALRPRAATSLEGLAARIARARLAPMPPAEASAYLVAALEAGRAQRDLLDASAVRALAEASGGLPRLLTMQLRGALFQARLEGAPRVQARHVELAEALRLGEQSEPADAVVARDMHIEKTTEAGSPNAPMPSIPAGSTVRVEAGPITVASARFASGPPPRVAARLARRPRSHRLALLVALGLVFSAGVGLLLDGPRWTAEAPGSAPSLAAAPAPATSPTGQERLGETSGLPAAVPGEEVVPRPDTVARAQDPVAQDGGNPSPRDVAPPSGSPAPMPPRPATGSRAAAEPPRGASATAASGTFRGTTFNETLGINGRLRLLVSRTGLGDAVTVHFEASGGLLGTGQLSGRLSSDGRLVARGTLMMGKNPFATELEGQVSGDLLIGSARYTRLAASGGAPRTAAGGSRGTFRLSRG